MSHLHLPGADAGAVEEVHNAVTSHTQEGIPFAGCNLTYCRFDIRDSIKTSKHHTTQKFSTESTYLAAISLINDGSAWLYSTTDFF